MREDICSCEVLCRVENDARRSVDEGCSVVVREDTWEDCAVEKSTVSVVEVDCWMGGGGGEEERDGLGVADSAGGATDGLGGDADSNGGPSDDVKVSVERDSLEVCEILDVCGEDEDAVLSDGMTSVEEVAGC